MTNMQSLFETVDDLTDEELNQLWRHLEHKRTQQNNYESQTKNHGETHKHVMGLHAHLGPAWMSDDFNDELSEDYWVGVENELSP